MTASAAPGSREPARRSWWWPPPAPPTFPRSSPRAPRPRSSPGRWRELATIKRKLDAGSAHAAAWGERALRRREEQQGRRPVPRGLEETKNIIESRRRGHGRGAGAALHRAAPAPRTTCVGGNAYYIGTTNRCSIGFSVLTGTQNGFVSAGHCGKAGNTTAGFNRVAQGVFQASTFPGSDYAWVAVNDNWTPRPAVDNGSGGTVPVAGSRAAIEGASVCRSGSTTDWHCGIIQQRDASVTYPQGNVFELTRTNVCAEPGDSGGSFISGGPGPGRHLRRLRRLHPGGVTYFQPIDEILTAYGLSLVTTAGNPPPLSTGTCTGYPNTATGTLTNGQTVYQPNNLYYRTTVAGVHTGCLDANDGVDFDLYLQKRDGSTWGTVATSDGPGPDEKISYTGTAGYYRYRVVSASGSGPYTLGYKTP